ncbi:MAG: DUF4446 family protein [Candidatus Saccharimonadales bacterium]
MIESVVIIVISTLALALGVFVAYRQRQINKQINQLFGGMESKGSLASTIKHYFVETKGANDKFGSLQENYKYLSDIAANSLQKTAIVRFNPFENTGGDQSFALSVLDHNDSGFILTSIHSREGTRIYIKPIRYGTSDYTLSKEEASSLEQAKNNTAINQ